MAQPTKPSADLQFEKVVSQRAFEDIAAQLRNMIATGRLKPGDRLPMEPALSAQFNVSRNTTREALRALELAGLIELRKGAAGGAYVLPGNDNVVVDGLVNLYHLGAITPLQLTEYRIWLSAVVVRVACERATEEDLADLEANFAAVGVARANGDFQRKAQLQREFHIRLAQATRNPLLETTMRGIMEVLGEFIRNIGPNDNAYALGSRQRFLRHLRRRDADAAVAEMTELLERLHVNYLSLWQRQEAMGITDAGPSASVPVPAR